jgi:putative ABC transport system permease protein
MRFFASILLDTRYALRTTRTQLGLTIVAVGSLGLAIGGVTAIFSVMYALILRPLPVAQPERLVEISRSSGVNLHPYAVWERVQADQSVFSGVLATYSWGEHFNLTNGAETQKVPGIFVSGSYFETLGVPATLGRTLSPFDDKPDAAPTCVISYGLWRRMFEQSPSVLGRSVVLTGHTFQIVGVAPKSFFGLDVGENPDVYLPLLSRWLLLNERWSNGVAMPLLSAGNALSIYGRLKPRVSAEQADAYLRVEGERIYKSIPELNYMKGTLMARPIPTGMSRSEFSETILLLMVMSGVGLIIACANLGNLLLARSTARQGEISTRLALGATRRRLIQQLLTESLLLSLFGAILGLLLKGWGSRLLIALISNSELPTVLDLTWDTKLTLFTVGVVLLTALLFGLAPAFHATELPLYASLKGGVATGGRSNRFSNALLIVVQVACSIALFYSAGLLIRTLHALTTKDPGYDARGVLVAQIKSESPTQTLHYADLQGAELLRSFRALPGIISASWQANDRVNAMPEIKVPRSGRPDQSTSGYRLYVSPDFFRTRRTPILSGREFQDSDTADAPAVSILSEQTAQQFFPDMNPVGLAFHEKDGDGVLRVVTVVGVAKNIDFQTPGRAPLPIFFRPVAQCSACAPMGRYEIRFAGPLTDITKKVQATAAATNSRLSVELHPLAGELDDVLQQNRSVAWGAGLFGLFAGILSVVGVYGVTSYATLQRTREIGIRIALGAEPHNVFRMVIGETTKIVLVGIVFGAFAGYSASQGLRGLLWGVSPSDPITLAAASGGMLVVAALAAFLPARRAMRIDPIRCLRYE